MELFKMNKSYLGIDIGSRNIKGIKLKKTFQGLKIVQMAMVPIPTKAIKQGLFFDTNVAIKLLREIQNQLKAGGKEAYLGFSGQHAIIREIEIPLVNERELEQAIYWEAEKVLPYPVEDAILDWIVLEKKRESDQMMGVLLVAGRKDYINSFLKPVKSSGIRPLNLSIFPIPLIHVLNHIPDFQNHKITAIIDMGAEVTHVLITKEGLPWLSRTIPIGGDDFTEVVANSYSLQFEEAEEIKIKHGNLFNQENNLNQIDLLTNPYLGIEEILLSVAQDVVGEVRRSYVHFQLHNRGQQIEKVFLTGGSSKLPGLVEFLQKSLEVPVVSLDLSQYFNFDQNLFGILQKYGSNFTEALGLALSEV